MYFFETAGESAGKAMARIYSNIGFMGLWNGLSVRIVMIGTLTVCTHLAPFHQGQG